MDPFKTRSATHKGSALSYARYYTLYRISVPPSPSFERVEERGKKRLKRWKEKGGFSLSLSLSLSLFFSWRFSRLICCYSCLRREDRPIPLDPQTFIMFFCNTSTNATGIAAFTRHPARSSRDLYFACIRPVCTPVFINRGKKKGWITEGCRCAPRAEGNVNDISREEVRNNILILLIFKI